MENHQDERSAPAGVRGSLASLARISHYLTAKAHDRLAITALRLLAMHNLLSRSDAVEAVKVLRRQRRFAQQRLAGLADVERSRRDFFQQGHALTPASQPSRGIEYNHL